MSSFDYSSMPLHQQGHHEEPLLDVDQSALSGDSLSVSSSRRHLFSSSSSSSLQANSSLLKPRTSSPTSSQSLLDERRRQRVLYRLGGASASASPYHQHHPDDEDGSEAQYQDPLHISQVGMDPQNLQASATSMSRKFFLTPPERLQVDQSVNLMDVETGQYDFTTEHEHLAQKRSGELPGTRLNQNNNGSNRSLFAALQTKASSPVPSSSSPQSSLSALFSSTSRILQPIHDNNRHSSNNNSSSSNARISFVEAFLDEEIGMSNGENHKKALKNKTKAGKKAKRRPSKKEKPPKAIDFPPGYDPNVWEERAQEALAKSYSLIETATTTTDNDTNLGSSEGDMTQPTSNTQTQHLTSNRKEKTKKRRRRRRHRRRLGKKRTSRKQKRLNYRRLAAACLILFVILMIILLPLVATGTIAWNRSHKKHKSNSHNPSTMTNDHDDENNGMTSPPPQIDLLQRNHTYLNILELPKSTQVLLSTPTSSTEENDMATVHLQAALQWMREDPHVTVVNDTSVAASLSPLDTISATQRFVLAALFYSTGGPEHWYLTQASSTTMENWLSYDHNECEWFGINQQYHGNYTVCNRHHQLHALQLRHHNMVGPLPMEELGMLSHLKNINLASNVLSGSLPPSVWQHWKNLEDLDLSHNQFSGTLPSEIGLLTASNGLHSIKLEYNQFQGTLPTEVGLLVSRLQSFEVYRNDFSGTIPTELGGVGDLGDYRALQSLRLSGNLFTGLIPSELGLLTQLTNLQLHHNIELTPHKMPNEICDLSRYHALEKLTVDCSLIQCPDDCACICKEPRENQRHPQYNDGVKIKSIQDNGNENVFHNTNRKTQSGSATEQHGNIFVNKERSRQRHRGRRLRSAATSERI